MNVVTKRSSDATWNSPAHAVGLFLRGHTLRTAIPTALVVGTILCAVNQGATVMSGQATTGTWVRMAINYAVPFLVASIGYLGARRRAQHHDHNPDASDQGD
jgi:hypothetical protein